MRLLVLLNASGSAAHTDVYHALDELAADRGCPLTEYEIYPFLARKQADPNVNIASEIWDRAAEFQPDAVLWSHATQLSHSESCIEQFRQARNRPVLAHVDGDMYHRWYKPVPGSVRSIVSRCDVAFWPGYNRTIRSMRRRGCSDFRYAANSAPGHTVRATRDRDPQFDVVMIANNMSSTLGVRTFPGCRWRRNLVKFLSDRLGNQFAVFGSGWTGPSAKGPVPFSEQGKYLALGRIAIGINNLSADYYFSNRLPITMSNGITTVHNREVGFDKIFRNDRAHLFFETTKEAWEICRNLLKRDQNELDEIGEIGRQSANDLFIMRTKLSYIINVLMEYDRGGNHARSKRANPWINGNA